MSLSHLAAGLGLMASAGAAALAADSPEAALQAIASHLYPVLGNRDAHAQPRCLASGRTAVLCRGDIPRHA